MSSSLQTVRRIRAATVVVLTLCLTAIWTQVASADEFRVESKVFAADSEKPISESITLFTDDRAFDLLVSPRETIIFDFTSDRIGLLDASRKVRTELATAKLTSFTDQLRTRAARQTDALLRFAADPHLEESSDDDGWMRFSGKLLTYRVQAAQASDPDMVRRYRQFSDASARLNSMLQAGAMPPFARLSVNEALARDGKLPEQVELILAGDAKSGGKPTILRSEHHFSTQLTKVDRHRIDEANEELKTFKQVSWEEYVRPIQQAKR
jgi:hypothetical protein